MRPPVRGDRLLVLLLWLAGACAPEPSALLGTAAPGTPGPARQITLHALVNIVDERDSAAVSFLTASDGQVVPEHGEVRTGGTSTVRLDFNDDSQVRLGPHSAVAVNLLGGADSDPLTHLRFGLGTLWVSLARGQFEAETPVGVATVRGSYAVLQYNAGADLASTQDDVLTIQCIEGSCTFNNGNGPIVLGNLQQLVISNGGKTLTGPTRLRASAVQDFLAHSPESTAVVPTLTAAAIPSATRSPVPSSQPLPSDTAMVFTAAPSATDTDTPAPTSVDTDTPAPTDTETPLPINTPRPPPVFVPTITPVPTETDTPPDTDTPVPTDTNTPRPPPPPHTPTHTPPPSPTRAPTAVPTNTPLPPTRTPSRVPPPTKTPSPVP